MFFFSCLSRAHLSLSRISLSRISLSLSRISRVHLVDYTCITLGRMSDNDESRFKFSIGLAGVGAGCSPNMFNEPRGLAFGPHLHQEGHLLFFCDSFNHRVVVYSCLDRASYVSTFGAFGFGNDASAFDHSWGVAIDHANDRILVTDNQHHRVHVWSLAGRRFLTCFGKEGSSKRSFRNPSGIAIDRHHGRTIVSDTQNNRLVVLSSRELSVLFLIGAKRGSQRGEFNWPTGVAVDPVQHRIIVADTNNHRVQVLSSIDGSFLFEFGSQGSEAGQLKSPFGVCVDNEGRIIVADTNNRRLQAFTHRGQHVSSFDCGSECPYGIAFDEHRGLIAFSAGHRVHVIGANQWLPDTESFVWAPDRHVYAPESIKQAVETLTMIRSVALESSWSLLSNELLFVIFALLEPGAHVAPTTRRTRQSDDRKCCVM